MQTLAKGATVGMRDAFLCHSERDLSTVLEIAGGLEAAGYTTWYYERDNVPGESYLIQVGQAIESSRCIILLVSHHSLASNQVTSEVVRAYEARIPFVPLLLGVSHREVQDRQQVWRQALVTSTSLPIPREGVLAVLPRVIAGLENLGIHALPSSDAARIPGRAVVASSRRVRLSRWAILVPVALAAALVFGRLGFKKPESRLPDSGETSQTAQEHSSADAEKGDMSPSVDQRDPDVEVNPGGRETTASLPAGKPAEIGQNGATDRRTVHSSVAAEANRLDMFVAIEDPTGIAQERLLGFLRSLGLRVESGSPSLFGTESPSFSSESIVTRTALLNRLGSASALLGSVRLEDVGEAYGLYAVRVEVRIERIAVDSTQSAASWTATEKASRASPEDARSTAIRAAVDNVIEQMRTGNRWP